MENKEPIVYEEIIAPVAELIQEEAEKLQDDAQNYKLSFAPFTFNILFAIITGIKSVSLLITHIKTSPLAKKLGLVNASKAMYTEAFVRYAPSLYRRIFFNLLEKLNFPGNSRDKSAGSHSLYRWLSISSYKNNDLGII